MRTVTMEYLDAVGQPTSQDVTVMRVAVEDTNRGPELQLSGFCHGTKTQRSFVARRIKGIADPKTGEILVMNKFCVSFMGGSLGEIDALLDPDAKPPGFGPAKGAQPAAAKPKPAAAAKPARKQDELSLLKTRLKWGNRHIILLYLCIFTAMADILLR